MITFETDFMKRKLRVVSKYLENYGMTTSFLKNRGFY